MHRRDGVTMENESRRQQRDERAVGASGLPDDDIDEMIYPDFYIEEDDIQVNPGTVIELNDIDVIDIDGQLDVDDVVPIKKSELDQLFTRRIEILDGVSANRKLTRKILNRGLIVNDKDNPHVYIMDPNLDIKLRAHIAHVSKVVESRIEKDLPRHIHTFQKHVIKYNDCTVLGDEGDLDGLGTRFAVSPVVNGIPVFVQKKRDSVTFYRMTDEGLAPMIIDGSTENLVNDIEDHLTFFCAFVGIIIKEKKWYSRMILVDYINNGSDISNLPYSERYVHLHGLSSLLVSDAFSILKVETRHDGFLEEQSKSHEPFFVVDMDHVNDGKTSLLSPARFKADGDVDIDLESIIFGELIDIGNDNDTNDISNYGENVIFEKKNTPITSVRGKRVCVTGRWENHLNRNQVKLILERNGVIWHPYVNSRTDLLVIASSPGKKKREKAFMLEIPLIGMKEFIELMNQ